MQGAGSYVNASYNELSQQVFQVTVVSQHKSRLLTSLCTLDASPLTTHFALPLHTKNEIQV